MSQINRNFLEKEILQGCIKVVSFDAEGTLVKSGFSQAVWHEAIPALYAQKKDIELAQAKEIVAMEYDRIGDQRLEWYDINFWFRHLQLGASRPVIESCQDKLCYYPEVTEVLSSLSSKYKLIIASGTPLELLHYLLQDVKPYFAQVFSSVSHYKQLKTPDFYLQMCQTMNIQPSQVVHVGDNWQFDFLNPKQVGINAFHIDRAGDDHQESISNLTELKFYLLA